MSDYCYSDRLLHMVETISATHGFRVLPVTAEPSGCPFPRRGVVPGRSVFQVLLPISRRILYQFQITCDRSHSFSVPSDSIIERSFPVFADLLNILNAKFLLPRLRLSWCADPRVWPKQSLFHLSNLFRLHIFRAVFYRSPDKIKFTAGILINKTNVIVVINPILTEVVNNC